MRVPDVSYQIIWSPAEKGARELMETGGTRDWAVRRCLALQQEGVAWLDVTERRHVFNGPASDFTPEALSTIERAERRA